jgi:hypothetical protein
MTAQPNVKKGEARCPDAPSTQEIIAKDAYQAPAWVRCESYEFLGDEDISTDRYYDPEFERKEYETCGPAPGSLPAGMSISPRWATTTSTISVANPS